MHIRYETPADEPAVHAVHAAAFPTPAEADLVDELRRVATPLVSLVAIDDGSVVGCILFSPVTLAGHSELVLFGLAPMAVLPAYQRHGIGSALVHAGLERCRTLGAQAVVVLGHPDYYPRFGFVPSTRFGIECEYDVPEDVFLALELVPGALAKAKGRVRYHAAFANL